MEDFLEYKTRGQSEPYGKPRVFLCSLPEDRGYFEILTEKILSKQNCSIWYVKDAVNLNEASDDYIAAISQMQLVVIPVTNKLLSAHNTVTETVLPYCLANCIPVLPIVQETGIVEKYAEVFGNLQFLDSSSEDETALSFDDKLQTYLDSVLVTDEKMEQIRKAFRSNIFLSYRKKDRGNARKLMEQIHSDDYFWDIAIWYDEFLIPGEDFAKNITTALNQCDLFLLHVTPSLLEKNNYVLCCEYPMALQLKKTVLPVETVPTSGFKLRLKFKKLPKVIKSQNTVALHQRLIKLLNIHEKPDINDSEKCYLIGLAYLNGINIEVNREKAVHLITLSAEKGNLTAIKALVQMYLHGNGVERNHASATEWQKKLVHILRESFLAGDTSDAMAKSQLIYELSTLGNMYASEKKYDQARSAYEDMKLLGYAFTSAEKIRLIDIEMLMTASMNEGSAYLQQQRFKEAANSFEESLKWWSFFSSSNDGNKPNLRTITDVLLKSGASVNLVYLASNCYQYLGEANANLGDISTAFENYKNANELLDVIDREDVAKLENWHAIMHSKAILHMRLAEAYEASGNFEASGSEFLQSITNMETLHEEMKSDQSAVSLSICYNKYGQFLKDHNDLLGAREQFSKSVSLLRSIVTGGESLENKRNLSISLKYLALTYRNDDTNETLMMDLLSESMMLMIKIESDNDAESVMECCAFLVQCYSRRKDLENALLFHHRCNMVFHDIPEERQTLEMLRHMSSSCVDAGIALEAANEKTDAMSLYKQSIVIQQRIVMITSDDDDVADYAFSLMRYGTTPAYEKDVKQSMNDKMKSIQTAYLIFSKLCEKHPDNERYAELLQKAKSTVGVLSALFGMGSE